LSPEKKEHLSGQMFYTSERKSGTMKTDGRWVWELGTGNCALGTGDHHHALFTTNTTNTTNAGKRGGNTTINTIPRGKWQAKS
jgi:hypothetical protein